MSTAEPKTPAKSPVKEGPRATQQNICTQTSPGPCNAMCKHHCFIMSLGMLSWTSSDDQDSETCVIKLTFKHAKFSYISIYDNYFAWVNKPREITFYFDEFFIT
jgi:hypothetical protein